MKGYKQLAEVQRYQIEVLKKAKKNQKEIAEILGVSTSTISRELNRNTGKRGYRPWPAHIKALNRRTKVVKSIKMTASVTALIEDKLGLEWSRSPE